MAALSSVAARGDFRVSALAIATIVFVVIFGGAVLGMALRRTLPEPHLSADTKDVVRVAMGLVATISALVLGLLIASAKTSYDTQNTRVRQITANLILADMMLEQYGPEVRTERALLREHIAPMIERIWRTRADGAPGVFTPTDHAEALVARLFDLQPQTERQRMLHGRIIQALTDTAQTRLAIFAEQGSPIPMPFLVVLVFWLTLLFASFSLFTPPNVTVLGALLVCALSAAASIYLILELGQPYDGLMQISSAPLRSALAPLGP